MLLRFKNIIKRMMKSDFFWSDFWSLPFSILRYGTTLVVSRKIMVKNKGQIISSGLSYIGFASNKVGLDIHAIGQVRIGKEGVLEIGNNVRIARGAKLFVNQKLAIGKNTYIQAHVNIVANVSVVIGADCAISWNCTILDDDFHTVIKDGLDKGRKKAISIGNHVWIGSNVTILKGVEIGENCIIAAGSVVSKSIPAGCLAGGIPAKIITEHVNWK